jgi:L-ascorbate metabolism protein UlaG (beta-lactamase superfamily)
MDERVAFRWLGVAGIELSAGGRTLVVDPYLSRAPVGRFLFGRVTPDGRLVREKLHSCDYVLVSHSHFDHIMDVPEVVRHTGAVAFGSPNTCGLLQLLGVPPEQIRPVSEGDSLILDTFKVDVLPADHGFVPPTLGPGRLAPSLRPPLRLRDYRMDKCFSFLIEVGGYRLLLLPGGSALARAHLLFVVPVKRSRAYYERMLREVDPEVLVPVHWDNMFRSLSTTSREFTRPGGMSLKWFRRLVRQTAPRTRFLIPEIFEWYDISRLCAPSLEEDTEPAGAKMR